ncbi:MAG: ATP-binding cassette domain-containing protein [Cyanobacteria bacterium P01_A01_bin.105]
MTLISVNRLSKVYPVAIKSPGLKGTLRHFFRRQYRQVEAVKSVSFSVESGEVVGFLGANGAGKTTTLKMLTGLIHPSGGSVQVAGFTPFDRTPPFLRNITLVMGQKQQLLWDLPALDSLRINAAIYDISDKEARYRIDELATMLDIREQLTQPVRKLSLGQRMKAEMLAALLHRPRVLFLDEPTLGLDVNAQAAVRDFLQTYNEQYQATVLLTSHYMADITALCDRVLLIHQGGLIYDGALAGLVERFAPYREVAVELAGPIPAGIADFGEVRSQQGHKAVFIVRRQALTQTVSRLLAELPVQDLTVADPPIEAVIGRVFQTGVV